MSNDDLNQLKADVTEYAARHGGKIYAPIMHYEFADTPAEFGHERFDIIRPHIPIRAKTVLDIGSHWGYFAHRFEDLGMQVTAAENSRNYLSFLRRIRGLTGHEFSVFERSIFDLGDAAYDIGIALNIFHHFLKTELLHDSFVKFLDRVRFGVLFFQAHDPREGQMKGSYKNFTADEFVDFIKEKAKLKFSSEIGRTGNRRIFKLWNDASL